MKKTIVALVIFLGITTNVSAMSLSSDNLMNNNYQKLIELTGSDINSLKATILEHKGTMSESEFIDKLIKEIEYENADANYQTINDGNVQLFSSGDGKEIIPLRNGLPALVFHTSAWTVYNHGHVGLYINNTQVAEAPGGGKKSRVINANEVNIVKNETSLLLVHGVSSQKKNDVINWAKNIAESGRPYNYFFYENKFCDTYSDYNCSQLVWCAYKKKANLDLDSNWGLGVYPNNIKNSNHVSVVATQ